MDADMESVDEIADDDQMYLNQARDDQLFFTGQDNCRMEWLAIRLGWTVAHKQPPVRRNRSFCEVDFDGMICWPRTKIDDSATVPCPFQKIDNPISMIDGNLTRYCMSNGSWSVEPSPLDECIREGYQDFIQGPAISEIPYLHLEIMYYVYLCGYSLSLLFLLLALAVFLYYRSLWCLRNIIHTNLIVCFALHNVTWLAYSIMHETQMLEGAGTDVGCGILIMLVKLFIATGFFWMFVEGFYLFINVMFSFYARQIRFWHCALIGWGIPLLLIVATGVVKGTQFSRGQDNWHDSQKPCFGDTHHTIEYIFVGPVLFLLFINLIFLFSIMYVVMRKLQLTVHVEMERYAKGAKALLILCPLLGINYVLVIIQPSHPLWLKLTFLYYTTFVSATQGTLVATFFCFRNNEVVHALQVSCRNVAVKLQLANRRHRRSRLSTVTSTICSHFVCASDVHQSSAFDQTPNDGVELVDQSAHSNRDISSRIELLNGNDDANVVRMTLLKGNQLSGTVGRSTRGGHGTPGQYEMATNNNNTRTPSIAVASFSRGCTTNSSSLNNSHRRKRTGSDHPQHRSPPPPSTGNHRRCRVVMMDANGRLQRQRSPRRVSFKRRRNSHIVNNTNYGSVANSSNGHETSQKQLCRGQPYKCSLPIDITLDKTHKQLLLASMGNQGGSHSANNSIRRTDEGDDESSAVRRSYGRGESVTVLL